MPRYAKSCTYFHTLAVVVVLLSLERCFESTGGEGVLRPVEPRQEVGIREKFLQHFHIRISYIGKLGPTKMGRITETLNKLNTDSYGTRKSNHSSKDDMPTRCRPNT